MSTVHLVRHAHAGDREGWEDDDRLRPLSPKGLREAEAIAERLVALSPGPLRSSPLTRCVETLAPLARDLDTPVEPAVELAEGASPAAVLSLVLRHERTGAVLCSHGDVIPGLLEQLARAGVELVDGRRLRDGDVLRCGKASTWELEVVGGEVVRATYVPPPGKA